MGRYRLEGAHKVQRLGQILKSQRPSVLTKESYYAEYF